MATISVNVKRALATALGNLPATSDGTEILNVVTSGDDTFDNYPTIRVLPLDYNRSMNAEERVYRYSMSYVISIYLELDNEQGTLDEVVIDTMQELVDNVFNSLDAEEWLEDVKLPGVGSLYVADNEAPVVIDVTPSKTGIALFADITYTVAYKKPF